MATVHSVRFSADVIETVLGGTVTAHDIRDMAQQVTGLGRLRVWFVSGEGVDGYEPSAIDAMGRELDRLQRDHGLEALVAVVVQTRVRMGASLVAMLVRMPVKVCSRRAEALEKIRGLLR